MANPVLSHPLLKGLLARDTPTYTEFAHGNFMVSHPEWLANPMQNDVTLLSLSLENFSLEISRETLSPFTFATYLKWVIRGIREQMHAKITHQRILLDSAFLDFVLVRDNQLWLYRSTFLECGGNVYTVSFNGPKHEMPAIRKVIDHVFNSVRCGSSRSKSEHEALELIELSEGKYRDTRTWLKVPFPKGRQTPLTELIPVELPTQETVSGTPEELRAQADAVREELEASSRKLDSLEKLFREGVLTQKPGEDSELLAESIKRSVQKERSKRRALERKLQALLQALS